MTSLKKVLSAFAITGAIFLSAFLPAEKVSATPASDWEAHGYPVSEWSSDNSNFHNIGFVNDPKTKSFKVFIEMNPYTEKNHNGTWGYSKLMPSGYMIKIGDKSYSLDLQVQPWSIQDGQSGTAGIGVYDTSRGKYKTKGDTVSYYSDKNGHQSALVTIPYSMFAEEDLNASSTVSFNNGNLGSSKDNITISGASTGPWLLAASAVIIAAPTVAIASRKKKGQAAHEK